MLENNEVQVVEEVAEAAVTSGLTRNQKVAFVVTATVLTGGVAYGIYRLVKFVKARKAEKAAKASEESTPEELHE